MSRIEDARRGPLGRYTERPVVDPEPPAPAKELEPSKPLDLPDRDASPRPTHRPGKKRDR